MYDSNKRLNITKLDNVIGGQSQSRKSIIKKVTGIGIGIGLGSALVVVAAVVGLYMAIYFKPQWFVSAKVSTKHLNLTSGKLIRHTMSDGTQTDITVRLDDAGNESVYYSGSNEQFRKLTKTTILYTNCGSSRGDRLEYFDCTGLVYKNIEECNVHGEIRISPKTRCITLQYNDNGYVPRNNRLRFIPWYSSVVRAGIKRNSAMNNCGPIDDPVWHQV